MIYLIFVMKVKKNYDNEQIKKYYETIFQIIIFLLIYDSDLFFFLKKNDFRLLKKMNLFHLNDYESFGCEIV